MNGLFLEGGPLQVKRDGDEFELSAPKQAWTDDYNVIYLDQPVTTGFSYGVAPNNMAEGS
jgi:carboxypeptidase C (cathepsin A)